MAESVYLDARPFLDGLLLHSEGGRDALARVLAGPSARSVRAAWSNSTARRNVGPAQLVAWVEAWNEAHPQRVISVSFRSTLAYRVRMVRSGTVIAEYPSHARNTP